MEGETEAGTGLGWWLASVLSCSAGVKRSITEPHHGPSWVF